MKNLVAVLFLTLTLSTSVGFAAEPDEMKMPGMSDEKMAKAMALMMPGENHRKLDSLVGTFKAKATMWMNEGGPASTSEGTSETKWILDGRFVQQTYKGELMGKPFEGMAIIGYDTVAKEYNSIWLDSVATGIMKSTAQYDDTAKTLTEEGTFSCPLTGKKDNAYKSVTTITDSDHYTYEMWHDDVVTGKNYKAMEIAYERA